MTTHPISCIHAGRCGGCLHHDMAYDKQLAMKQATLAELFAKHWTNPIDVVPSPNLIHYRNKIELNFDRLNYDQKPAREVDRPTVLGFRERGKWYATIDVEECQLFSPWVKELLPGVRQWYRRTGLRYFHNRSEEGFLKHLVLRESKNEPQRLAMLITAPGEFDPGPFVEAMLRAGPRTSIFRGIQIKTGDVAFADEVELLHGSEVIHETLHIPTGSGTRDLRFEIGPQSFFQVNPPMAEQLYGAVRQAVADLNPTRIYDLYGGSGGIAFSVSDLCDEVISVESFEGASDSGRRNADMNGINNVRFETAPMKTWLQLRIEDGSFDSNAVAIVDPPRSAMHPKALQRLIDLGPQAIVYVSCNPKLLARELDLLTHTYDLTSLRGFDLFPHTDHMEVVTTLVKKG